MAATKKNLKKTTANLRSTKVGLTTGNNHSGNGTKTIKKSVGSTTSNKKTTTIEKISTPFNKSTLIASLAEKTELNKKQVSAVLDNLINIIGGHIKKGGPEKFVFPGAFKVVVRKAAAKKARSGINPFTGETTIFKAKPASRKIRIIPLKSLKDLAL